jgi:hydroxymethylglutaryl-CoA lyase
MENKVKIIECPRDAMQGIEEFIPTEKKIKYLNSLLKVGFDVLDFGSFVSPKAIPQMKDTAEVLEGIDLSLSNTELLAIVANLRGAEDALKFDEVSYLGFPFSISETFQQRNTNSSIAESVKTVAEIQNLCKKKRRKLVIYISMAFGNPYGDAWDPEIAAKWTSELSRHGIQIFAMADTVGIADAKTISDLLSGVISEFPKLEIGAHLHTTPKTWKEKMEAAWNAGCRRFDGALLGYGGCPMAADKLTGNMATENIITFAEEKGIKNSLPENLLKEAMQVAKATFS